MDDGGKYYEYQMYTARGNYRVHQMVEKCRRVITTKFLKIKTRELAIGYILREMDVVAKRYGEVFDTESHWAVCDAMIIAFQARGWKPYNRFED